MVRRLADRLGYAGLPAGLSYYLLAVSVAGPVAAVALLATGGGLEPTDLLAAVLLAALAGVAERYPLHLTHKTSVNLGTAAYLAMLLVLPPAWPALLALLAAGGAQAARYRGRPEIGAAEPLFNAAQATLYVAAAVPVYAALGGQPLGPDVGAFGSAGAIAATAAAMHLANTALVAAAAGLQMGVSVPRVWWQNLGLDLTPHITLTVLGLVAASVAHDQPYFLPALALPGVLVHRAVAQTVRLRVDTHEALASLVEVVELRDPYTAGHSRRVAATARLLAGRLGLTAEEADVVESAGRVHDIGKVAVDSSILQKPGKLTDAEWRQMRQHPELGANVVERFAVYQRGTAFVRHHHEAWDGSGYPGGLAGETIPLGARILAVADTFDALTSDRPYRPGKSVPEAAAVLEEGAGRHWDPEVVAAFRGLLAERPGEVPVWSGDEQAATAASALLRARSSPVPDGGGTRAEPPVRVAS